MHMHMIKAVVAAADVVQESRRCRRRGLRKQLYMQMQEPRRMLRGLLPSSSSLTRVVDAAVVVDALNAPRPRMHLQDAAGCTRECQGMARLREWLD